MAISDKQFDRVATTVITGFLGSGKTTLLNALLSHDGMAKTAVLINEFGEIGLDHLLVREVSEDVVLLNSGCICCSVSGWAGLGVVAAGAGSAVRSGAGVSGCGGGGANRDFQSRPSAPAISCLPPRRGEPGAVCGPGAR